MFTPNAHNRRLQECQCLVTDSQKPNMISHANKRNSGRIQCQPNDREKKANGRLYSRTQAIEVTTNAAEASSNERRGAPSAAQPMRSRIASSRGNQPRTGLTENKINRSGENDLHPRSAFGERWDLIGGKIGGKAPRRRRGSARRCYSAGAFVCCMGGTPRGSPDLFQQWRAIVSMIACKTAEPVSCDSPRRRLRRAR
jgi:hypothetical protein